jgi:CheY-like chemotaxis protein
MLPGIRSHAIATHSSYRTPTPGVRSQLVPTPMPSARPLARILVSEDNPDIQRIYSGLLPGYGFELISVPGGDGALTFDLALRGSPDLVITDINKPALDGFALAASLRADTRTAHIPVLMVTAMDPWSEPQRARISPISDYLVKPFPFEVLLYRIIGMLNLDGADHSQLVERAIGLPCYDQHHPTTGLPCMHGFAAALAARGAQTGWAAIEVSLADQHELLRSNGRPVVDAMAGRLAGIIRRLAGPEILVGHSAFDTAITVIGPSALVGTVERQIHERFAALAGIWAGGAAPTLALRRADGAAGLTINLLDLRAAMR